MRKAMNKTIRLLAALLGLMLALCPCALAREDTSGLLATVNGVGVPMGDALAEYEHYAYLYSLYGMDDSALAQLREDLATYYVQTYLLDSRFYELELSVDENEITRKALEEYEDMVADYILYYGDGAMSDDENRELAVSLLAEEGYTADYVVSSSLQAARTQAVAQHYTADMTVSEEALRAEYEQRVEDDRMYFESDPSYYEDAVKYGDTVYYTPEGFRTVKHILILFSEEDQTRMKELESRLKGLAEEDERRAEAEAERAAIIETVMPRVQEIQQLLAEGADFISLMDEYGEDPGMQSEPNRTNGYLVHAQSQAWVLPFRDAAMALEKPGDVSGPVATGYGVHLIRYEADMPAGDTPYEEVCGLLEQEMLEIMINTHMNGLLNEWYEEADVTLYPENFIAEAGSAAE